MKQCDGCNNWLHQHCENFEITPNSPYNSSNCFRRACQKLAWLDREYDAQFWSKELK